MQSCRLTFATYRSFYHFYGCGHYLASIAPCYFVLKEQIEEGEDEFRPVSDW